MTLRNVKIKSGHSQQFQPKNPKKFFHQFFSFSYFPTLITLYFILPINLYTITLFPYYLLLLFNSTSIAFTLYLVLSQLMYITSAFNSFIIL